MNSHPPCPLGPLAVITAMAALLTAACGSSSAGSGSSPAAGGSASSSSAIAYSRCVRSHGVPDFPDPGSGGQISKPAVVRAAHEVSDSVFRAATDACQNLNPAGQGDRPITAQDQQAYLRAAACMRSHGITAFPDPVFSGGRVSLPTPVPIDTSSPRYIQALQICRRLIPAGLPGSGSGG